MQNNPITEIFLGVIAALFVVGAVVLLYFGKIDATFATLMFGAAAALFGGNLALKAPSPSQQATIAQLLSDVTATIPVIFQHTHPAPSAPPVTAPAQPTPVTSQARATAPSVLVPVEPQVPFPNTGRFPVPQ